MKVFSKTHALTIAAAAFLVAPKGVDGKPLPKTNLIQAPAGTVVEMDEAEARSLIAEGLAVEFKEDEHKAVEGVVPVATFQRVGTTEPLPEGMTQPSVVRQDETLNDGRVAAGPGVVVVGDTKENEKRAAIDEAARAAALAAGGKTPEQLAAERQAAAANGPK